MKLTRNRKKKGIECLNWQRTLQLISFTLQPVPLANGDTIGGTLFSFQKNWDWEKARSSRSSSETCKMLVLQGCHNKIFFFQNQLTCGQWCKTRTIQMEILRKIKNQLLLSYDCFYNFIIKLVKTNIQK